MLKQQNFMLNHHLDFQNTAIAFADKTDAELHKKYWLFKVMNSRLLNELGTASAQFALALGLPIGFIVKNTVFEQFCGGETIEESEPTIQKLAASNIGTILDYSAEGQTGEEILESTKEEIKKTIARAKSDPRIPFSVFKTTGLARRELLERVSSRVKLSEEEEAEWQRVRIRVRELCEFAHSIDQPIFIDAEESWIQDAVDSLAMEMMSEFNRDKRIVFNTLQLYRVDRLEFLKSSFAFAKTEGFLYAVKLVRGAYMEKERERAQEMGYPSPIHSDKVATDRDFDLALEYCVENIDEIAFCAGTHNEESVQLLTRLLRDKDIRPNHPHVFFSQLYGMSDNLSYILAKANYNVSKYVPYGPVNDALPYLIRRAQENTSVVGQVSRELELIQKELRRRKIS